MSGIQELVDGLAERLGMPVGVDDRRFHSVAYSSHPNEIDPVRRMSILGRQAPREVTDWLLGLGVDASASHVRVPANEAMQMVSRVCFPLRLQDRLLGYLWLTDPERRLSESTLTELAPTAAEMAYELYREQEDEQERQRTEADTVLALTHPEIPAPPRPLLLAAASHRTVAVAAVEGIDELAAELRLSAACSRLRRGLAPRQMAAHVNGARATVVLLGSEAELDQAATRLLEALELELSTNATTGQPASAAVGLGRPRGAQAELPAARHEAELALSVARSAAPYGPLARFSDLEAYQLIAELTAGRDLEALLPDGVRALLEDDDAHTLVSTVETYLERGGDAAAAARELFIHRSSLYNRLHRVAELTGIDVRTGAGRLTLQLGLRLWRLSQPSTSVEPQGLKMERPPSHERV